MNKNHYAINYVKVYFKGWGKWVKGDKKFATSTNFFYISDVENQVQYF